LKYRFKFGKEYYIKEGADIYLSYKKKVLIYDLYMMFDMYSKGYIDIGDLNKK
jgi:hypothetical protein